ncbi:sulfotransferase family protein [Posidoniimonas corsicana]|uniref:sulfotransferase family protein n=1 Tax=Posidoniimonas corsicana TaxID=1938618 RepID=UPI0011B489FF
MSPALLITGTRRSGTTLLFQALSGSTGLWCRNELHEVHRLLFSGSCSVGELSERLDGLGLGGASATLSEIASPVQLFDARMSQAAADAGKPRWCLKDPEVSHYLIDYAESMPSVKFIIIVRDPRAVARSFLERGTSCNWYSAGERWAAEVQGQLEFRQQYQNRCLLLRYEDLVKAFANELQRVCDFVGLPMEEAMIRYHERDSGIRIHEGNRNVRRPPDPSINEKWRESLSGRQLANVEAATAEVMTQLGYKPESSVPGPSALRKEMYRLHNRLVWEYRWQRASRWYGIRRRCWSFVGKTATWDLSSSHGKFR